MSRHDSGGGAGLAVGVVGVVGEGAAPDRAGVRGSSTSELGEKRARIESARRSAPSAWRGSEKGALCVVGPHSRHWSGGPTGLALLREVARDPRADLTPPDPLSRAVFVKTVAL